MTMFEQYGTWYSSIQEAEYKFIIYYNEGSSFTLTRYGSVNHRSLSQKCVTIFKYDTTP